MIIIKLLRGLNYLIYSSYRKIFSITIISCLLVYNLSSQELNKTGQVEVVHFSPKNYQAHRQNWSILQSKNHWIYAGNSKGLLEYDGNNWQVHQLPLKQIVRSVAMDSKGKIYSGGLGEFGYWEPSSRGKLTYHSLSTLISDTDFKKEEVWNILPLGDQILFQSFAFLYLYKNGQITNIKVPSTILFAFEVNKKVYLEAIGKGLYELKNNQLTFVHNSEFLGNTSVNTILPTNNIHEILIGTSQKIYRFDGEKFTEFSPIINRFIKENQLNKGIRLANGDYALGTILNGVIIASSSGEIKKHFNRSNGLQDNTVLSLLEDEEKNLWIGLDKGLDLIRLNSPMKLYHDADGQLGNIFDALTFNNNYYLATNHGVFYSNLKKKFTLIPQTQGQAWNLEVIDNQLFCGHNNGTFIIDGSKATQISTITGGWAIKKLKSVPNTLIQGTYTKLSLYKLGPDKKWIFDCPIEGFSAPVRQLEEDNQGNIWVNTTSNGIAKITVNFINKTAKIAQWFSQSEFRGLQNTLSKINQKITLTTPIQSYFYDEKTQNWVKNRLFKKEEFPLKVFPIGENEFFVKKQNGYLQHWENNQLKNTAIKISNENDEMALVKLKESQYLVSFENGFGLFNSKNNQNNNKNRQPYIRSLQIKSDSTKTFYFYQATSQLPQPLNYLENHLIFNWAMPTFSQNNKFSYWLEPYSNEWSKFQDYSQIELEKLPFGKYTLHLKSDSSTKEQLFEFEISPPWFWNIWSKSLYVILFAGLIWGVFELHKHRLKQKQEEIRRELEYKLVLQEEKSKQEIIKLRNEKLENDLVNKSEELSNIALSLIKRSESLGKIKQDLELIKPINDSKIQIYTSIIREIERNISDKKEWKLFQTNFNEVHEIFFKKLMEKYDNLTHGDLGLAAYLRMNLSSKEIAQLLNITPKSVELKRYRLRKKMGLHSEQGLSEFFMKF
jgi:ligand-binding sensor domain-containing protein/DNA-binding CsgD family transcriptional regulator